MANAKLTPKQARFIDEYLIDLNATQAAIRAGYSNKGADVQGIRLLGNVRIQKYIQECMAKKDAELIAKQDEVLQTLTRILRREEKETVVVTAKKRRSFYDDNGKKCIVEEEEPVLVEIPTKVSDVNRAAELLGKRYSLYTDKLGVDLTSAVKIIDDIAVGGTDGD